MPFTKFNSRNLLQVPEKRTFSLASLVSNQGFDQNINLQYSREYRNLNKFAYIFKMRLNLQVGSGNWEVSQRELWPTLHFFILLIVSFVISFCFQDELGLNLTCRWGIYPILHSLHVKSKKSCKLKENYSVVTFFIRYCYAFSIFWDAILKAWSENHKHMLMRKM